MTPHRVGDRWVNPRMTEQYLEIIYVSPRGMTIEYRLSRGYGGVNVVRKVSRKRFAFRIREWLLIHPTTIVEAGL